MKLRESNMAGNNEEKLHELLRRIRKVDPLPDEKDFHTSTETLARFLKAREWKVDNAEKQLRETMAWRKDYRPALADCEWCHDRPGHHSLRQIGFDVAGRPVVYSCFSQATARAPKVEDSVRHLVYLIENAKHTMAAGISQWVFILDCTGMTIATCNPKLAYGSTQIMSNHYPERLGMVVCLNHSPIFQGFWNSLKAVLPSSTLAKVHLLPEKSTGEFLARYFSSEVCRWLMDEVSLNKRKPMLKSQLEFWAKPLDPSAHDPRGCPSYVAKFVEPFIRNSAGKAAEFTLHKPHPNVLDDLLGTMSKMHLVPLSGKSTARLGTMEEAVAETEHLNLNADEDAVDREGGGFNCEGAEFVIAEEYKLPDTAQSLQSM